MQSPVKIWRNQKKVASRVGKIGTVISWTMIRIPPGEFSDQAPYPVVLVALESGSRIMAQFVDYKEKHLHFKQKVITVIRRVTKPNPDGVIPYGIKVKPL